MGRSVTIKGGVFVGPRGGSPRLAEWTYVRLVNRLDRVIWTSHGTEVPATITVSWETPAPRKRTASMPAYKRAYIDACLSPRKRPARKGRGGRRG